MSHPLRAPALGWAFLKNLLGESPRFILDVGANDGGTSSVFQSLFDSVFVHAFEPDPRAIANIENRLKLHKLDGSRFALHRCAVSNYDGDGEFFPSTGFHPGFPWYSTGYDLSGSLNRPLSSEYPGIPTIKFSEPFITPVVSLDRWANNHRLDRIDMIWMDLQGGELNAIRGGSDLVRKCDYIYLECEEERLVYENQPSRVEIEAHLPEHSLIAVFDDGNILFRRNSI